MNAQELLDNLNRNVKKENRPEPGKQYALTGTKDDKCIANGDTWEESEDFQRAIYLREAQGDKLI